ncbi:uncharacterized protein [Ptychodera flava]|uniref:uncharacterized protein n=1 Tax=Ptychodera flava TaxID=63121 RepID=UPI003969DFA0
MTLLRGQLSNKEQECSNLKSQLEGSQRENVPGAYSKRIHERIERAGTLISLKRVEIASLADQIHSRELEISSLEQHVESCQNKLDDLGDQFISGTIEQPAVESQYQQTFKLLEESEKQILSKETTINVLREQIAQLKNEITLLKKQSIDVV